MSAIINLNTPVRLKLTGHGQMIWIEFHLRFGIAPPPIPPGGLEIPLWQFAQVFGPKIHMAMPEVVTVKNELEVLEK